MYKNNLLIFEELYMKVPEGGNPLNASIVSLHFSPVKLLKSIIVKLVQK